jgi:hypothetical protein
MLIIRKLPCFFYDTMISHYLLSSQAYYKRYRNNYSQKKRQVPQEIHNRCNNYSQKKRQVPQEIH